MSLRLIRLNEGLVVREDQILRAWRSGNTTYVDIGDRTELELWDPDSKVWDAIACRAVPKET